MKNETMRSLIHQELHQQESEKTENAMEIWDKQSEKWNKIQEMMRN